jgi:hypothetical protein
MIRRNYFVQQVAIQTTTDRKVAAGLIDKAADLKERLEGEPLQEMDVALRGPSLAK